MKSRLINYFSNKLCFWAPPGKGETVFSDEVPTEKAFEWNLDGDESNNIESAAKDIRKEILHHPKTFTKWPPSIGELYTSEVHISAKLEKLLINILSSKAKTTERLSRLVQFIGQDLIYNTTRGTNRQLKHVQLGLNLKRKTGLDSKHFFHRKHFFHFTNMFQVYEGLGKEFQVSYERLARKIACYFE